MTAASEKQGLVNAKVPGAAVGESQGVAAVEADAGVPEVDAGAPEQVDAGAPRPVAAPVAARVAAVSESSGGFGIELWTILLGVGGLAIVALIVIARRRSNPRDPNR